MYPCDDTWEFINLALLCVACLFSERKESIVLVGCTKMQERMRAQNVQYASLLVMRRQVLFSKDEEDIQSPSVRTGSPGNTTWSSSISCLHVYYTYLAKERKCCLQEKWPRM